MYKVRIYSSILHKQYFWYIVRCLQVMRNNGDIDLEVIKGGMFGENERAYDIIYVNDYPIFIDLRDDFTINRDISKIHSDFLLLKANYSSELWGMAERGEYPEGIGYRLEDWELKLKPHIKPFVLGRTFISSVENEFVFSENIQPIKYEVVSLSGMGILKIQSQSRLKTYDLFDKVFGERAKLMFFDRDHLNQRENIENLEYYLKKYSNNQITKKFDDYIKFLSLGKYSINIAGIALSTPFRFIDSVIANRCCISTKIWHDLYSTFPCVQLPICSYLGTGDWNKAEEILRNIDKIDYNEMNKRAKDWYSWFLSVGGMWRNQILKWI